LNNPLHKTPALAFGQRVFNDSLFNFKDLFAGLAFVNVNWHLTFNLFWPGATPILWQNFRKSQAMFQPQIFQYADLPVIGILIILEGLLSADNALVLAVMVRHLPKEQRQRALLYGLGGAFVFRAIAILAAGWIMQLWWLQSLGALYLIGITVKHFLFTPGHSDEEAIGHKADNKGFWQTVVMVELADIAFAVDSVLAGVSLVAGSIPKDGPITFENKVWVVYAGAIIGIILLRFAAGIFIKLLEKYPFLEHMAYLLVGWAGVKLLVYSGHNYTSDKNTFLPFGNPGYDIPILPPILFWGVLTTILVGGTWHAVRTQRASVVIDDNEIESPDDPPESPQEKASE